MKTAFITGSGQGLGLEITMELLSKGWFVYGLDVVQPKIRDPQYQHIDFDLKDSKSFKAEDILSRGPLDVLIFNAGFGYYGNFSEQPLANIQDSVAINLFSPLLMTKRLLSHMKKGGAVIFIGSVSAFLPAKKHGVYGATKAALIGFSRALRRELAPDLFVRIYHPGPMKTGFHKTAGYADAKESFQQPSAVAKHFVKWLRHKSWQRHSRFYFKPAQFFLRLAPTLPSLMTARRKGDHK